MRSSRSIVRPNVASRLGIALFCILALLCITSRNAEAQDSRAKLMVTVTDSSGALIPNAALQLQSIGTKIVAPGKTDADGAFLFQFLEPDTYTLKASAPNMNGSVLTGIVLQAYAATSVKVELKPASANEEITVTSEAALLETESAARTSTIDTKDLQELPVSNGNTMMLGADLPGVYMRPLGVYTDPWTVTSQFLINGGLMSLNDFQIDGSPNDSELGANTYAYTPPQFASKEFSVSANNYDARYGHTSGGVINISTMGGTQAYHGMGWSSFRRTDWNANTDQNKYENWLHDTNTYTTPFNTQTQLGFQVGGPVKLPKVHIPESYKPFFFFAFDHYTELLPRGLLLSYPTAKMRTGDFSELLNQPGYQDITINDPDKIEQNASGQWVRPAFDGNIIPSSRINPVAKAIAALFPDVGETPSGERVGTNNLSLPNNYYNWHYHNLMGRFDLNAGDKTKIFFRPFMADFTEVSNAGGAVGLGEAGGNFSRASKGYLFDFVRTLTPSTVLNARYGYTRFTVAWTTPNNETDLSKLNFPSSFISALQSPNLFGIYTFSNYNQLGWNANLENTGTYSVEEEVVHMRGRHTVRLGSDLRLTRFNYYNPGSYTVASDIGWTQDIFNDSTAAARSGDSFASFLLGTPASGSAAINPSRLVSTWYVAPWIQDDWRVLPHLTLNFGFRYDVLTGPVERHNALNTGFDPNVPSALSSEITSSAIAALPAAANLTGGLTFAGINNSTRQAVATVYHNIQPRFGFAWQPIDRLVFRGGYGLFYTNFQSNAMLQQTGFSSTTSMITSNDTGIHPIDNVLSDPFPTGLVQPTGAALGTMTAVGTGFTVYNPHYTIPSANEMSLGVQLRIGHNGVLDTSYVGNRVHGYDMNDFPNYPNHAMVASASQVYGNSDALWTNQSKAVTNPFKGIAAFKGTGYYTASTETAWDMSRPHPQFAGITESGMNGGKSFYDALQVSYRQHMSHGVSVNTSYTWSKQIEQWGWLSPDLNLRQKSVYLRGLPHVFKVDGVYQLPFGRNRRFNMHNSRVLDAFVGGWDFSPELNIQSGEPIDLPTNAKPLATNKFYHNLDWHKQRVQGWSNCVLFHNNGATDKILNPRTGCETAADANWISYNILSNEQVEESHSDVLRMKASIDSDAALQKSFQVREGISANIRLSATNVLNHFNILTARFNTTTSDVNFGTIVPGETSSSDCPPRNVNVQIRVSF